ncbi:sensor histidine kinase [Flavobacterium inviolabile]|uniref:sensor histidine kinase n=1 Tax=Flavobacterium inviolabile TaxID=2748320 RepID=UPI0015B0274E|nr:histidine kinase [Flavobacterium inviolabile]
MINSISGNFKNRQLINLLVDDRYRLLRHFIFLAGFFLVFFYTNDRLDEYRYTGMVFIYAVLIGMFYINMYLLLPRFFFRANYLAYIILLLIMVILGLRLMGYILNVFLNRYHVAGDYKMLLINAETFRWTFIVCSVILISTTIKLLQRWILDTERMADLRNITLNMELNELKNQINPHFLFNMLNNVNVLIKNDPEKASVVIFKLSEFLRYQLYENNEEQTSLASEVRFLSNFLNLEKIRRDNFQFNIAVAEQDMQHIYLPPNLFTTFVENAVKHSIDITGGDSYINISITAENKKIHFKCVNSKKNSPYIPEPKSSGLGFANIQRRLELLYRNNYSLDIAVTAEEYILNLTIPI